MIKDAMGRFQINTMLLNETNAKWDATNTSEIEQHAQELDRELSLFSAYSNEWEIVLFNYLPSRVLIPFFSKHSHLENQKKVIKGMLEIG